MSKEAKGRSKKHAVLGFLSHRIPIIRWLRSYSLEDAISDFIAGITLGLTITPQSIAYAALAGLTPQDGLNSAFIGCFVYGIFGTVKEVVIGPSSLMALLTYEYTHRLSSDFVVLLCFLCSIVQFLMGLFHLGFFVQIISAPVVSGFTTATSLIIIVSQMKGLIGINFKSEGIVDNMIKLCKNVHKFKFGDTVLGISCIIFLLLLRKLKDVKVSEKVPYRKIVKNVLWFLSTGRNALIVFISGFLAYYFKNNGGYVPFITTRSAEASIPSLRLPPLSTTFGNKTYNFPEMVSELGTGYIIIPVISVLANVAIAKAYVNGAVDATQEMVALSLCNLAGSMVQSMPTTGAFTRSALASASGIRTPIASFYSAGLTLMALGTLGSYFHYIPRATLSAVLIAAVVFLIDLEIVKHLWKKSWLDLITVFCTLISCLALGVEVGLFFGVVIGLINLVYRWARPEVVVQCRKETVGNVVVVHPKLGLYFPAVEYIVERIQLAGLEEGRGMDPVYVDCSRFTGTDYSVAKGIASLKSSFDKRGQPIKFVNVPKKCYKLWVGTVCKEVCFTTLETGFITFDVNMMALKTAEDDENIAEQEKLMSNKETEVSV